MKWVQRDKEPGEEPKSRERMGHRASGCCFSLPVAPGWRHSEPWSRSGLGLEPSPPRTSIPVSFASLGFQRHSRVILVSGNVKLSGTDLGPKHWHSHPFSLHLSEGGAFSSAGFLPGIPLSTPRGWPSSPHTLPADTHISLRSPGPEP